MEAKEIIITEIGAGISYYQELYDWAKELGLNPDEENFDALSIMEGDPDKIKCDGHSMYFIDTDIGGVKYILTSDYPEKIEKKMLAEFHQKNMTDNYTNIESTWDNFNREPNAIAYRGGSGYVYSIWNYTPQTVS